MVAELKVTSIIHLIGTNRSETVCEGGVKPRDALATGSLVGNAIPPMPNTRFEEDDYASATCNITTDHFRAALDQAAIDQ